MSRNYSMTVIVSEPKSDKTAAIQQAAAGQWDFDDWHESDGQMFGYGEGRLGGGESEEEFADRLAKAIWNANGGFCEIELRTTYLDDLPYVDYCLGEDDYERLTVGAASKPSTQEETSDG